MNGKKGKTNRGGDYDDWENSEEFNALGKAQNGWKGTGTDATNKGGTGTKALECLHRL